MYIHIWIGLDWIGLDWIGLDWTGLDRIGSDWIGLDWIGLDRIGLDWIGLDWIETRRRSRGKGKQVDKERRGTGGKAASMVGVCIQVGGLGHSFGEKYL